MPDGASDRSDALPAAARVTVARLPVYALTPRDALEAVLRAPGGTSVHLCNAYTAAVAAKADDVRRALCGSTAMLLTDGTPLARTAARRAGSEYAGPTPGPNLMRAVLASGGRHYLYGSSPAVLAALRHVVELEYPTAELVGAAAPPFSARLDEHYEAALADIRSVEPDFVWVGLGTPKQDLAAAHFASNDSSAVYIAVGAAFDFIAGTKREAPRVLRGSGFEWLFRLATEPRRLWRRYLLGNAQYLQLVATDVRRKP